MQFQPTKLNNSAHKQLFLFLFVVQLLIYPQLRKLDKKTTNSMLNNNQAMHKAFLFFVCSLFCCELNYSKLARKCAILLQLCNLMINHYITLHETQFCSIFREFWSETTNYLQMAIGVEEGFRHALGQHLLDSL